MLNKLTCDQIADTWEVIKDGLEQALPYPIGGLHRYRESNILTALLSGAMECWMLYEKDEENKTILLYSIIITVVHTDECTGNKSLYVFAQMAYRDIPRRMWAEGFKGLLKYGKSRGCMTFSAHTDVPGVIQRFKRLGGDTSLTYVTLPIGEVLDEIDE